MAILTPFRRTARPFADNSYFNDGNWLYVRHPDYAYDAPNFVRAFLLIQKDVLELFDSIEPSDANMRTHSHRIHELLLRTCVEVEANCTAILRENRYHRGGNWNMSDYVKIQLSHFLSEFRVKVPNWRGQSGERRPFYSWQFFNPATPNPAQYSLNWYQAYNATKHDRHLNFERANFESLIDAVAGLSALLASQFLDEDFSPAGDMMSAFAGGPTDGYEPSIGGFFRILYPDNVPDDGKYGFSRDDIDFNSDIFQSFPYP